MCCMLVAVPGCQPTRRGEDPIAAVEGVGPLGAGGDASVTAVVGSLGQRTGSGQEGDDDGGEEVHGVSFRLRQAGRRCCGHRHHS